MLTAKEALEKSKYNEVILLDREKTKLKIEITEKIEQSVQEGRTSFIISLQTTNCLAISEMDRFLKEMGYKVKSSVGFDSSHIEVSWKNADCDKDGCVLIRDTIERRKHYERE